MKWYDAIVTAGFSIIEVSPQLKFFVASHIRSVWQLDILLLLRKNAGLSVSTEEIASQLYLGQDAVRSALHELVRGGMAFACDADCFSYCASGQLDDAVRQLDLAYSCNRVDVISLIFADGVKQAHD